MSADALPWWNAHLWLSGLSTVFAVLAVLDFGLFLWGIWLERRRAVGRRKLLAAEAGVALSALSLFASYHCVNRSYARIASSLVTPEEKARVLAEGAERATYFGACGVAFALSAAVLLGVYSYFWRRSVPFVGLE